jgi:hypothetical protein
MRTSEAFVLGAIMGAAVVWLWGREMEEYVAERTRGVRTKAAVGVRAVEETAGKALDRGGDALRRADEFLQDTKQHVSEALRVGEEAFAPRQPPEKHDPKRDSRLSRYGLGRGQALRNFATGACWAAAQTASCARHHASGRDFRYSRVFSSPHIAPRPSPPCASETVMQCMHEIV